VHEQADGSPVVFDEVDLATGQEVLSLGFSGRVFGWAPDELFDMELSSSYIDGELEDGELGAKWNSLDVFAGLRTNIGGVPVSLSHDGRYSLEGEGSLMTRTTAGIVPTPSLGVELSHHRALDGDNEVYYEAAALQIRYVWSPKWEFEARQTLSVLENSELGHALLVRRRGHDMTVELGVSSISGEDGSTITLKFRPELLFRPSKIGYVQPR
jgi:hypothetical protein